MSQKASRGLYTSNGFYVSMVVALVGGATWAAIDQSETPRLGPDTLTMIRLTVGAAWLGGLAVSPLFGRPGKAGMALALVGAVLSTVAGASLAATIFDPVGLVFGPIFVFAMIFQSPLVATVWIVGMTLAHLAGEPPVSPGNSGST